MRSVPSMRSRLSGLASSSASAGRTGRMFANSSSPLRRPSRPCSGRGSSGFVESHLGPPTAASRTASESLQAWSDLAGERGAVLVDRRAADQVVGQLDAAEVVEHLARGVHDLGADPVAGKGGNALRGYGRSPCLDEDCGVLGAKLALQQRGGRHGSGCVGPVAVELPAVGSCGARRAGSRAAAAAAR